MTSDFRFRFTVLGRYRARLKDNESHVTVNLAAGRGDHMVYCGTLTLSDPEWDAFSEALSSGLGDRFEIVDPRPS